jgi:hypothetical protein
METTRREIDEKYVMWVAPAAQGLGEASVISTFLFFLFITDLFAIYS